MSLPTDISTLQNLVVELISRVEKLEAKNSQLEAENAELKCRLDMNSNNSSKPPSSDGYSKKPAIPKARNKKQGGQKGHKGKKLNQVASPDLIVQHYPKVCTCGCGLSKQEASLSEKRQVFDLPVPRLEITEHQLFTSICPSCGEANKANAPVDVNASTQYGNGVRAFTVLLTNSYKLPINKVKQLFEDLFGQPINESTVYANNTLAYQKLEASEAIIKASVLESSVAHADETGLRVEGKLQWLHNLSSDLYTYLFVHSKRGKKAMLSTDSILPSYTGWLVHDCLSSYFKFDQAKHAICNAHILRELQALSEKGSEWSITFKEFLLELYGSSTEQNLKNSRHIHDCYDTICQNALTIEPEPVKKLGKKGRPPKTKGRNLAERLVLHKNAVLAFAFNSEVPFTNNLAERDVRPAKLKQKISGCLRTFQGAQVYARVEGFVSSVRKNKLNIFKELKDTFRFGYNSLTTSVVGTW